MVIYLDKKITLHDLLLIFGEDFIPADIDKKILMKHFEIGENRIIGKKTIEKIKEVLVASIETTRNEQNKERGRVIESPLERLLPRSQVVKEEPKEEIKTTEPVQEEDRYGLKSIKSGIVTKRLLEKSKVPTEEMKIESNSIKDDSNSQLPSVEELTVLSGSNLKRNGLTPETVKKEVAIREFQAQGEDLSKRWGEERIKDREGKIQEINNPAYIFHSDLWQFEEAREINKMQRCEIMQHVVLDMVANNINVVMLENEEEPFFVVEGYGILHSKESLKGQVKIDELIQILIISSEAWQIALKKPEAMIRGIGSTGRNQLHAIDMTSIVPLANIRAKIVDYDGKFKVNYENPEQVLTNCTRAIENHRKNIIWTSGATTIDILRDAAKRHRALIDTPSESLNMVVLGTNQAFHPMKIRFNDPQNLMIEELLPDYCKKHSIFSEKDIKNIFGSIPAIYDLDITENINSEFSKIADAVYKRIGFSAIETIFEPGYIQGSQTEMIPISKLDIILPPPTEELQQKLIRKGLNIEQDTVGF